MERVPFASELESLRAILMTIPDFIVMCDRKGRILYMNRVQEDRSMASVVGKDAREFIQPESQDAFDAALEATWNGDQVSSFDMAVRDVRGGVEWFENRVFPLRRDGQLAAALLIARDVTELRAAERDRDRLRQLLPKCAWCERVQAGDGEWQSIEAYLTREAATDVSHGLCPDCAETQPGWADAGNGGG